mgnify:CR=1 FL=1
MNTMQRLNKPAVAGTVAFGLGVLLVGFFGIAPAYAQVTTTNATATHNGTTSTSSAALTQTSATTAADRLAERAEQAATQDRTQPEELPQKVAIFELFDDRPVDQPGILSFMAYWVQQAVALGVPANTIFLILLTPFLALLVSLVRVVIGLPTLDMLVPIALAFVFVAVGITVGMMVLAAIFLSSYFSKMSLKRLRIMFYPKRSLSILFISVFVLAALTLAVSFEFERIVTVSIFPILILMLLGDSIVSVQLTKSIQETILITVTTIALGLLGYVLAVSEPVRNVLLLYPELVLLTIPANIMIGRYFGLRLTEYVRFTSLTD